MLRELGDGRVDEEGRVAGAGAAPDYIRRSGGVSGRSFCNHSSSFRGICEIGRYVGKVLGGAESAGFDVFEGILEFLDVAGDYDGVGALRGQQSCDAEPHALRSAGDEDGLFISVITFIWVNGKMELTRPSTGNWFPLLKKPILSASRMETKTPKSTEVQRKPNTIASTPYVG